MIQSGIIPEEEFVKLETSLSVPAFITYLKAKKHTELTQAEKAYLRAVERKKEE
jgi:hypothetical protein